MKKRSSVSVRRKLTRRLAASCCNPGLEVLENRLLLASLFPVSLANPAIVSSITANAVSSQGSVSADGRYVAFVSSASNLVPGQVDTIESGVNLKDVFLFDSHTNTTTLVSHAVGSGLQAADKESDFPVISADGKYIVYASRATNLDSGQSESEAKGNVGLLDLFLYDVQSNSSSLISHNSLSLPTPANGDVVERPAAISADGRYVAFASSASNMVSGVNDGNAVDVFLYDRLNPKSIRLISRSASSPQDASDTGADQVTLSANGQFVAFQSFSSDFVPNQDDRNGHADIFLYDVAQDSLRLVTGAEGSASVTANGPSFQVAEMAISAHGRYLAFRSFATDLVVGQMDANNNSDVFLFDRLAATANERMRLVSHDRSSTLTAASGSSAHSDIPVMNVDLDNYESSGDGLFIAYQSTAQNLVAGVTDTESARDLFLYDVGKNSSVLVSHAAGSPTTPAATLLPAAVENAPGKRPVISRSGRYLAYSSPATDLVPGQADSTLVITNDVFRYDRLTGNHTLLSGENGSASQTGDSASEVSDISADGQTVVFSSLSTNLIDGDSNLVQDMFVSVPEFALTYTGRQLDLLNGDTRNTQDGINDGLFTLTRYPGSSGVDITKLELQRGDGTKWSTTPGTNEFALGAADSILGAINELKGSASVVGGGTLLVFAADSADSRFKVGERFTLTAHLANGTVATVESDPIPASFIKLAYNGKLRDRVGRGDAALSADGQKDGTFTVTFPLGTGILTSLELDRGDGNHWNTAPNDDVWVIGAAQTLDLPLINNADGSLAPQALWLGGELILFAPEDRPEASSFFTAGKSFQVIANFQDGSQQVASVTLSSFNVPPPQPDLTVSVSNSPNVIRPGEKSTYSVAIKNIGDGSASNVQLRTSPLPAGVQFVAADSPANCEQLSTRVVCTFGGLAVGEMKSVSLPFTFASSGSTSLSFEASAIEIDANPQDNLSSDETRVLGPLQITLSDSPDPVHVGEDLTYEIIVTNPNPTPAADLFISSPVPEDATFVSVSTTLCRLETGFFQCNLDQLDPGQSLPFRFVVRPTKVGTLVNLGAILAQGGTGEGSAAAVQTTVRPANDDFAKAQPFPNSLNVAGGVTLNGTNINATEEIIFGEQEPHHAGVSKDKNSVWYSWTAPYTAWATFKTVGSDFDTLLAVYRNDNNFLREIASGDDQPAPVPSEPRLRTEEVFFLAQEGRTYYLAVDGFNDSTGTIQLHGTQGPRQVTAVVNAILTSYDPVIVKKGESFSLVVQGEQFSNAHKIRIQGEVLESTTFVNSTRLEVVVPAKFTDKVAVLAVEVASPTELAKNLGLIRVVDWSVAHGNAGETVTASTTSTSTYHLQAATSAQADCGFLGLNCVVSAAVYATGQAVRAVGDAVTGAANAVGGAIQGVANTVGRTIGNNAHSINVQGATRVRATVRPQIVAGGGLNDGPAIPPEAVLIAVAGPTVVSNDGAGLIGQDGAGLIGQDGAGLIGQDGAGLIGQDGAGLIGQDGAGEGEFTAAAQASDWMFVMGSGGIAPMITNQVQPDGSVAGSVSVMLDDTSTPSIADLANGMIFMVVVPDKIQFEDATYSVAENGSSAAITVTRSGTGDGRVTVDYATADDTATTGSDFTSTSGTLVFESGEMSKTFRVPITFDKTTEDVEEIKLTLNAPGGIVRLGSQITAQLSITAPSFPWKNVRDALDVNDDKSVEPLDALLIINELNSPGFDGQNPLPVPPPTTIVSYFDVSGDGYVAPLDALLVINYLNANPQSEPEGVENQFADEAWLPLPQQEDESLTLYSQSDQSLFPVRSVVQRFHATSPKTLTLPGNTLSDSEVEHADAQISEDAKHCELVDSLMALFEEISADEIDSSR